MPFAKTSYYSNSVYLEQLLKTAAPHIHIEFAIEFATDVNRYRLFCGKCEQTLTYASGYGVDGVTVDNSLQEFIKAHLHKKFETPKGNPVPLVRYPYRGNPAIDLPKTPRRRESGRKMR